MIDSNIIDGKKIAKDLKNSIKAEIELFSKQITLAVILLGEDPASTIYVKNKQTACKQVGIISKLYKLNNQTSEQELLNLINNLNNDNNTNGILVQLPLPEHINSQKIIEAIDPNKDVDGFHPKNFGKLAQNKPNFIPCTPKGIMILLEHINLNLEGLDVTVVGCSNIVGKPLILDLINKNCTVSSCHKKTKDLKKYIINADLVIVAAGVPNLIKGSWIKKNAVVIDVGINRLDNGKIVGDVEFEEAKKRAAWITPVPGGVGPLTIACLLQNTLQAAKF